MAGGHVPSVIKALISADKAMEIGLISHLIEQGQDWRYVFHELRNLVSTTSNQAVAATKKLLRDTENMKHSSALAHASMENAKARATDDCKKGIEAFLNKEGVSWE